MSHEHDEPPGGGSGAGGGTGAEKADRHLRRALDEAAPEEELRAIVTVKGAAPGDDPAAPATPDAASPGSASPDPTPPHPKDYPDRVAYRQAMIEHHGKNPRARVGAAREALEKLGLTTRGEGHAGLLMVQGPARRLADALELESVGRVALDRHVGTPRAEGSPPDDEAEAEGQGTQDALGLPPGDHGSES